MAAWDALAKAAGLPLCVLLGGTIGPVKAYNSNGLWLRHPELVAAEAMELRDEGGFTGLKLWLGRENVGDDLKAIDAVRVSVGDACHAPALGIKAIDAPGFKVGQKLEAGHV